MPTYAYALLFLCVAVTDNQVGDRWGSLFWLLASFIYLVPGMHGLPVKGKAATAATYLLTGLALAVLVIRVGLGYST